LSIFEHLLSIVEEQPLSRSLPAALRIATAIGDEDLASWIRLELMGYLPDNPAMTQYTVVPEYRSVAGQWRDDYGRPLLLEDPNLGFINETRLRPGVAELEGIAGGTGMLAMRLTDFSRIIREHLNVEVTIFEFRPSSVSQILTNVKVRLLDQLASQREAISALPDLRTSQEPEILHLKPGIYGMSIDLKALWRRVFGLRK
jgi:hypothetical protein